MIIRKIHFVIDKTPKASQAKKIIFKKYKNYPPNKSNVIVVVGGDGFMLQSLKKYQKYNKPFYGMNRGSFGFLMNTYKSKNIRSSIIKSKAITISALQMQAVTKKNLKKNVLSINEISLLRQSKQTASLKIIKNKKILIKKLICDGPKYLMPLIEGIETRSLVKLASDPEKLLHVCGLSIIFLT